MVLLVLKRLLGFDITSAPMRASLCFVTALVLMLCFIGLRQLMNRPYGRVLGAIRDSENRLQFVIARFGTSYCMGAFGGDCRYCRGAVCPAGRHYQSK